jgi:sulfoxide reductase catalytic subunit YedY
MLIRTKRRWEIPEAEATPESVFLNRRTLLAGGTAVAGVGLVGGAVPAAAQLNMR